MLTCNNEKKKISAMFYYRADKVGLSSCRNQIVALKSFWKVLRSIIDAAKRPKRRIKYCALKKRKAKGCRLCE